MEEIEMDRKEMDWENIGFTYRPTEKRYVSNFKDGAWDDGVLTEDANIVLNECAGVLQYAQTIFEGMKAYTTAFCGCSDAGCEGKLGICTSIWIRRYIIYQAIYVREQSCHRCKTGR